MVTLELILEKVCEACDVTPQQLIAPKRSKKTDIARSIFYYMGWYYGFHPTETAATIKRSRPVCIIMTKRCRGHLMVKDKLITRLHDTIINNINKTISK